MTTTIATFSRAGVLVGSQYRALPVAAMDWTGVLTWSISALRTIVLAEMGWRPTDGRLVSDEAEICILVDPSCGCGETRPHHPHWMENESSHLELCAGVSVPVVS